METIMDFTGRTALVTGAAGAIGKGVAAGFLKGGARVFITDLDPRAVEAAVRELGGGCHGLAADVTKEPQVAEAVSAAAKALDGQIDILVNVAGIVGQGKVEDLSEADWDRMFAVNCKGTFLFVKHVDNQ